MKATDDQLMSASDSAEIWSWWFGGFVVVGVVAEFALAIGHPAYDSPVETWGSAFADALVALGVAGEILFGLIGHRCDRELTRRSDEKVAVANEHAAEANAQALKAQLELEKFRKPWELPHWKVGKYANILKPFGGTRFAIHRMDDIEQERMAATLHQAFHWAGWKPHSGIASGTRVAGIAWLRWFNGVEIRIPDVTARARRPAAEVIASIFAEEDIEAPIREVDGLHSEAVHILIGRKT